MARKSNLEMLGDSSREAGILVLVFGFLDGFMQSDEIRDSGMPLWLFIAWVLFLSVCLLGLGMAMERNRPLEETPNAK